ncbi:MAG: hypothetical protein M1824_005576 [Vezdaea acicularis]|nr:MAG: hypothetical protein M1824_005576 [Vezdaea acicularis]
MEEKERTSASERSAKKKKTGDSTFLPTLLGGYWSGSESAEDLEVEPLKKNRRGQRARRQIWEAKYGSRANHLRGKEQKDNIKNAAEGRKNKGVGSQGRGRGRGRMGAGTFKEGRRDIKVRANGVVNGIQATGANSMSVSSRPIAKPFNTDAPLHPSWLAAKKAKEQKTQAHFQGKKITFD